MFIIIQIPFVDLRLLGKQKDESHFYPHQFWDKPNKLTYYRYFGSKHYRYNNETLPKSEHSFFDSQKLLKFSNIPGYSCKLVFARLFTDDIFFHLDIGLRIKSKKRINGINLLTIIQHLFENNVFISNKKHTTNRSYNVHFLRQYIESLYSYATTFTKCVGTAKNNYLYFGKTSLYCQSKDNECFRGDLKMVELDYYDDIHIQKTTLNYNNNVIHLWFIENGSITGATKDLLRRLRICLLKLNNYREGLDGIFQYLSCKNIDYYNLSDLLHIKFSQLLNILDRARYYGIDGKHLMDYVVTKESALYYESWEENKHKIRFFLARMEDAKHNQILNIGELIMRNQVQKIEILNSQLLNSQLGTMDSEISAEISGDVLVDSNKFSVFGDEINQAIEQINMLVDLQEEQKKYLVRLLNQAKTSIDENGKNSCRGQLEAFKAGAGKVADKVISILANLATIAAFFMLNK